MVYRSTWVRDSKPGKHACKIEIGTLNQHALCASNLASVLLQILSFLLCCLSGLAPHKGEIYGTLDSYRVREPLSPADLHPYTSCQATALPATVYRQLLYTVTFLIQATALPVTICCQLIYTLTFPLQQF